MAASQDNKRIARILADAFGINPSFKRYWDDKEQLSIDIIQSKNPVDESITDYGTIGLSDYPLYQDGEIFPIRLELVGTSASESTVMANLLTTSAFTVINDKWFCFPGAVLMDVIKIYDASLEVKHLFFVTPGLWDDNLQTEKLDTKTVTWLHAIPITEAERIFIIDNGTEELEKLFYEKQVDIANLKRGSVV